jgi:hypothetical protein
MSRNAIVYSIHSSNLEIEHNANFQQLRYSIDTIRKYNKSIDIKVYISPSHIFETRTKPIPRDNVEYIPFDAKADPRFEHQLYALWTSHKWENAFRALEEYQYDNVLYTDADTLWQIDPEYIFAAYGDEECLWAKQDVYDTFINFLNLDNEVINDGVILLSKKMLKYKNGILKARIDKVLEWQEQYSDLGHYEMRSFGIQWVACQYAVSEYLHEINLPPKYFNKYDVAVLEDYEQMTTKERSTVSLLHYYSFAAHEFLPKEYVTPESVLGKGEYAEYKLPNVDEFYETPAEEPQQ